MSEENKKNEIVKVIQEIQCFPIEDKVAITEYEKVSFGYFNSLGAVFSSVAPALKGVFKSGGNGSSEKLYKMIIPNGLRSYEKVVEAKDGLGNIGNVIDIRTGKITQRARYSEIDAQKVTTCFNPTTMFMAMALSSITKKLDKIEDEQEEILTFLQLKEKAILKGNITILNEILEEYKFNCDNEKFKNNKHVQVQEIKRDSEQGIIFCRERITKKIEKHDFFHGDKEVKSKIEKLQNEFKDYELAIFVFAFSTFVETMLLENFSSGYLQCVANKIESNIKQYGELKELSFSVIEKESKTTTQSYLLKGVAGISRVMGKGIAKIPKIRDGQVDEALVGLGGKVDEFNEKRISDTVSKFEKLGCECVYPFVDSLNTLDKIYNGKMELLFDNENIYYKIEDKTEEES